MNKFIFRRKLVLQRGHCDPSGAIIPRQLFELFDVNTWMMFEDAFNINRANIGSRFGIMGFPLVGVNAEFQKQIEFGDTIEIASSVAEFRRSSFDVAHDVFRDEELVIRGSETRIWATTSHDDPGKLSAVAVPKEVRDRLSNTNVTSCLDQ